MKRIFVCIFAVLLVATNIFVFASCKGNDTVLKSEDPNFANYDEKNIVDGSAYDLFFEAYTNWLEDTGYVRYERFSSKAYGGSVQLASREVEIIRQKDGDKIFSQEVLVGTSVDKKNSYAKKYYFDGSNAYLSFNDNTKEFDYDSNTNTFSVKKWNDFAPYEGDVQNENYIMVGRFATYDFTSRDYLADSHNDKVYKVDDTYYISLTLDCSYDMLTSVFRVALDDILDATDYSEEGFKMQDDIAKFDFAIQEIDGKMKFTVIQRTESFSGKYKGSIPVNCQQTNIINLKYTDYEITNDQLLNLAK